MKIRRFLSIVLGTGIFLGTLGLFQITEEFSAVESTPDIVVVLDPGHDSRHGGASYYGYKEHEIVYKIATYCKQELEQYDGVKVIMTRNSNSCPYGTTGTSTQCNTWRVDYAQSVEADVYISLHLNAAENKSAKGAMIYYPNANYRSEFSTQGKKLAVSILDELIEMGISKQGVGVEIRNSQDNSKYPDGSLADYLIAIKGAKLRGFPAVLIEHLFLSNQDDVNKFLTTEEKIKEMGIADATGIAEHFGLKKDIGLKKASDGKWYYYVGDTVDTSYTGLASNQYGWWYVESGKVDLSKRGLVYYRDEWWYVEDGQVKTNHNGIANNEYGTWYVENGKVDFGINGLVQCGEGWYLFENGAVQTKTTTLVQNEYGWWYVKSGQVDFSANTVVPNAYGTWYVENGKVDFGINGLAQCGEGWYLFENGAVQTKTTTLVQNEYGWWYVKNGQVDFNANTVVPNAYGTWYVENGEVKFSYNGLGTNENGTWYIENGGVNFGINGLAQCGDGWYLFKDGAVQTITTVTPNEYGWWYIKNGKVDFGYNGLAKNEHGTWYIKDGNVKFEINGLVQCGEGWYLFKDGAVQTNVTDLVENTEGLWYIKNGKVDSSANTVFQKGNEGWYIKNGKVDFTYNGLGTNEYGTWYIANGQVNFNINGLAKCGDGEYYFKGGKLQEVTTLIEKSDGLWYLNKGKLDTTYNGTIKYNNVIYTVVNGKAQLEGTKIMEESDITAEQMVTYYNTKATYPEFYQNSDAPDILTFCQIYLEECAAEGVSPEVAFCQAMLETGFLKFGGQVDISQYNFAGIGAVDGGASGAVFPDVRTGIRAQVQHLKAYACSDALNQECVDPRFNLVKRGSAPYLEWLGIQENPYTQWGTKADGTYGIISGKGWASAKEYGFTLASKYVTRLKNVIL